MVWRRSGAWSRIMFAHTQKTMADGRVKQTMTFTVNTEATAAGEKTASIPFNLYNQPGVKLNVNWGDGNTSTLTSANYAADNSMASVHEYATAGIYQITITSKNWSSAYFLTIGQTTTFPDTISTINNANAPIYYWRRTLISINEMLPRVNGRCYYKTSTNVSSLTISKNSFGYLFSLCTHLVSFPSSLFNRNLVYEVQCCFYKCTSLASIPSGLFDKLERLTNFLGCFCNCTSLASIPS